MKKASNDMVEICGHLKKYGLDKDCPVTYHVLKRKGKVDLYLCHKCYKRSGYK